MPKSLLIALVAVSLAVAVAGKAQAVPPHCPADRILSDFSTGDAERGFSGAVKQGGTVSTAQDPLDASNPVAAFSELW